LAASPPVRSTGAEVFGRVRGSDPSVDGVGLLPCESAGGSDRARKFGLSALVLVALSGSVNGTVGDSSPSGRASSPSPSSCDEPSPSPSPSPSADLDLVLPRLVLLEDGVSG
jgi:hypothetical protein